MNKRDRVQAALCGAEVDRVPISLWGHSHFKEWSAEGLAEAMLENYHEYDWDYMKVNPRASYHVEDWGATFTRPTDPDHAPPFVHVPVRQPEDWRQLRALDPGRGVLGQHLASLRLIRDALQGEVFFLQTIFSPLSIAKYLAGNQAMPVKESMTQYRASLEAALDTISRSFAEYAQACVETGAAGIYFATTGWASRDELKEDEYRCFGVPYDLRVLEAVAGLSPFNVLHNCGDNIYFDLLADYPVSAISWAATLPGNPTLEEGKQRTQKAVMGGISEKTTLMDGTPGEVAAEVERAIALTGGRRLLLGPGCSIAPRTPRGNLEAAAAAARRRSGA